MSSCFVCNAILTIYISIDTLLIGNVEKGAMERKTNDLKDVAWASTNCTQCWSNQGIWTPGLAGNDINSVDALKSIVASGDDFGKVQIYNYPASTPDSPHDTYTGHSSHVTNVRFSKDGNHLISVGGHDNAIFQWLVVSEPK